MSGDSVYGAKQWLEKAGIYGRPAIVDVVRDCPKGHEVQGATEILKELFTALGFYIEPASGDQAKEPASGDQAKEC